MTTEPDGSIVDEAAEFGQLKRVSAKSGWPHEAYQFTPWLASHLQLLGEALGLSLELVDQEHAVGKYSLDLLLRDQQDRAVIVENQFDQTDHDHLGKLLTYCAGTEADVVVWIAEHLNAEHVAALGWLNENTVEGVGFFGVELELLRIDNSLPAPNFRVVVKPNDWVKKVRPAPGPAVDWDWEKYESELSIPETRIDIGRDLVERIQEAVDARGLPWFLKFRKGYVAIQRASGYNVMLVDLWWKAPTRLAVKVPNEPQVFGLTDPYPQLAHTWDASEKEFGWTVPSLAIVPDVGAAIDLVIPFHPKNGPMFSTPQGGSDQQPSAGAP